MLVRFSLYGFLKNQRYFEPFLVLALLEKGASFFVIGLLVAVRGITVNALEVPSGAIADVWGRRRSMIVSFAAYVASFVVFGLADRVWMFFPAMVLFGVGEAFRSGTHKAMIFTWLRMQGRIAERTRVYGFTRSWSQIGSALSAIIAPAIVIVSGHYHYVFTLSVIPYLLGIGSFLTYPRELDGAARPDARIGEVWRHMLASLRDTLRRRGLRRLVAESMGFEGVFDAVKDYLQPVLQAAAVTTLAGWLAVTTRANWLDVARISAASSAASERQQTALLVGLVYLALYLLSAVASRYSHRLERAAGGQERASLVLWAVGAAVYAAIAAAGAWGLLPVLIGAFALLHALQSAWRPLIISRFDTHGSEEFGASLLSIESQAQRVATMILAPVLGLAIDGLQAAGASGGRQFWPVGVVGLVVATGFLFMAPRRTVVSPYGMGGS